MSDNNWVWQYENKVWHFHKKVWQHLSQRMTDKKVWQPQSKNHKKAWQYQDKYHRWQCHKSERGIVTLTSLECRTFQAYLLSNYFITKALVNVRLCYERTGWCWVAIKIDNLQLCLIKTASWENSQLWLIKLKENDN